MKRTELRRTGPFARSSPLRRRSRKKAQAQRVWPAVKALIHLRDEFACRRCGFTDPTAVRLNAHHVQTRARGGSDEPENLVTLRAGPGSPDCHGVVHRNVAEAERDGWLAPSWAVSA